MNGRRVFSTMLVGIALLGIVGQAAAEEFWAQFVMKTTGEILPVKGTIFVKNGLVRHEVHERGDRQVTIVRPDKGVIWVLNTDDKMYLEIVYQEADRRFDSWTPEKEKKARLLGKDAVSGIACKKYELLEEGNRSVYWVSAKLNFPLKVESPDATMEYKNIDEGPLADTLFEPPDGYDRITMDDPSPADREPPIPEPLKRQN
jgi:hypothetical protein